MCKESRKTTAWTAEQQDAWLTDMAKLVIDMYLDEEGQQQDLPLLE